MINDSIDDDLSRLESALSNVYECFNSQNSMRIKTKDDVEIKCRINPRKQNHHKSDLYQVKPIPKMRKSNRSEDYQIKKTEEEIQGLNIDSQLRIKKKNIRVSQNSIMHNYLESCSSSVSSKVGSIKGILKKRTSVESSISVQSRSISSGNKSVKFNLQTGALRNHLNQWK